MSTASRPARVLLGVIRGYRMAVSPALAPSCRYLPTCSAYAAEAVEVHGAARGSRLALGRLLRCHPFHPGGYDPVPPRRDELPGVHPAVRPDGAGAAVTSARPAA